MKKISIWRKARLYFLYRKTLLQNKNQLIEKFGARIDNVSRIYTVLNVPKELIDDPYNIRKSDIDELSKKYIKEYSIEISKFLDSIELKELYTFYQAEKVDKFSYLLVFGFSVFDTNKFARKLIFRYIPISVALLLISLLFFI